MPGVGSIACLRMCQIGNLTRTLSMDIAAFCDYCGTAQTFETLVDHQNACLIDAQQRVAAAIVARYGVSNAAPGAPDHTLQGDYAAALPIIAISRVFCDTKRSGCCPRACEILPGLWLGSADVAHNTVWLQEHGIRTIINAAKDARPLPQDALAAAGVRRLVHLPLHDDSEAERLASRGNYALLRSGAAAIGEALGPQQQLSPAVVATISSLEIADTGALPASAVAMDPAAASACGAVFVHCAFGRSRSAAVVAMHLVLNRGLPLLAALVLLRARRPITLPNQAFTAALIATEEATASAAAPKAAADGARHDSGSVPDDLQLTQYALVRQFNMQTGAPLPSGAGRSEWNDALSIARSLALPHDAAAPVASLPANFQLPVVWSAPLAHESAP